MIKGMFGGILRSMMSGEKKVSMKLSRHKRVLGETGVNYLLDGRKAYSMLVLGTITPDSPTSRESG